MVVIERDASSFRDVELAAAIHVYRAFVGWKSETDHVASKYRSHCLLLGVLLCAWETTWAYYDVFRGIIGTNKKSRNKHFQQCSRSTL